MLLEYPWYEASIAYLVNLVGIAEPDQVVDRVLVGAMHGIIQSTGYQA